MTNQSIENLLDALADLRDRANVNAVFGEPVSEGGTTIIPIAEVSYAFGVGGGEGPAEQGEGEDEGQGESEETITPQGYAAGGGMRGRPVGVVEVGPKGTTIKPFLNQQRIVLAGILLTAWSIFWIAIALGGKLSKNR